jgi:molybdenum cofactor cytidylyltransferase
MSASLKTGIEAVPAESNAALVMLGDMTRAAPAMLRRLVSAYRPAEGRTIVVPVHFGKRGNPVLWDRRYFEAIRHLSGDVGARHLIGEYADQVVEVEINEESAFLDVDTPEAYSRLRSATKP